MTGQWQCKLLGCFLAWVRIRVRVRVGDNVSVSEVRRVGINAPLHIVAHYVG